MSFRRYEILRPIRYNDGSPVEEEKFSKTRCELVAKFGAVTKQAESIQGWWAHEGQIYEDRTLRLIVDAETSAENLGFLANFKGVLKARFRQIDIHSSAWRFLLALFARIVGHVGTCPCRHRGLLQFLELVDATPSLLRWLVREHIQFAVAIFAEAGDVAGQ